MQIKMWLKQQDKQSEELFEFCSTYLPSLSLIITCMLKVLQVHLSSPRVVMANLVELSVITAGCSTYAIDHHSCARLGETSQFSEQPVLLGRISQDQQVASRAPMSYNCFSPSFPFPSFLLSCFVFPPSSFPSLSPFLSFLLLFSGVLEFKFMHNRQVPPPALSNHHHYKLC